MEWYCWILFIIILSIGGCIINRILFWTGAFIWEWSRNSVLGYYWFEKGTTIESLMNKIRFDNYINYNDKKLNKLYNTETDSYESTSAVKYIPIINVIMGLIIFSFNIIGFILCMIFNLIKLIIHIIDYILDETDIINIIRHYYQSFISFLHKIGFTTIYINIISSYKNIKEKILNFKIS